MVRKRTIGETQEEADALEDIARLIVKYFPSDSGIHCRDVVTEVIRILETKSGPDLRAALSVRREKVVCDKAH